MHGATHAEEPAPDGQPKRPQIAHSPWTKDTPRRPCLSATAAASPLPGPVTGRYCQLLQSICPSSEKQAAPLAAGLAPALLMLRLCSNAVRTERQRKAHIQIDNVI